MKKKIDMIEKVTESKIDKLKKIEEVKRWKKKRKVQKKTALATSIANN